MQRDLLWGAVQLAASGAGTPRPAALGTWQAGGRRCADTHSNGFPLWPQRCGAARRSMMGPSSPGLLRQPWRRGAGLFY